MTEPADVAAVLPEREIDTHKRATGVLVVVAGSRDMTGAAGLVARGAGRIGTGLVQVAVPEGILPIVQAGLAETTFLPLPETSAGTVSIAALGPLLDRLEDADALAIGPGLSGNEDTAEFVRRLVRDCPVPFVLDADGLNAFTGRAAELADRKSEGPGRCRSPPSARSSTAWRTPMRSRSVPDSPATRTRPSSFDNWSATARCRSSSTRMG